MPTQTVWYNLAGRPQKRNVETTGDATGAAAREEVEAVLRDAHARAGDKGAVVVTRIGNEAVEQSAPEPVVEPAVDEGGDEQRTRRRRS